MNCVSRRPGFSKWCGRSASNVTASPSLEVVRDAVADQPQPALRARTRSRGCRPRGSAGRRARRWRRPATSVCSETSARCPGSGRRQHLVAVAVARGRPAAAGRARTTRDAVALVEAQQLRERQLEAGGDLGRHRQRRAGLARARPGTASAPTRRSARPGRAARGPSPRAGRGCGGRREGSGRCAVAMSCGVRYHIRLSVKRLQ